MPSAPCANTGTDRRGYCRRLRAWLTEPDCRQYRRPEPRYSGRPLRLNLGCQNCPGLEWEAPAGAEEGGAGGGAERIQKATHGRHF